MTSKHNLSKVRRLKRAKKTRGIIARNNNRPRLTVIKTLKHVYAQLFTADGAKVLASVSTLDKDLRSQTASIKKAEAATLVGSSIGKKIKELGFENVAFDRSGFIFHGVIKNVADAVNAEGVNC